MSEPNYSQCLPLSALPVDFVEGLLEKGHFLSAFPLLLSLS